MSLLLSLQLSINISQILNELTYHENRKLASAAEQMFNRIRCQFACSGQREFMEEFVQRSKQLLYASRRQTQHLLRARNLSERKGRHCSCAVHASTFGT